jgi:hypothetical protein
MAFQSLDTGSLDVFSAITGSAVNIPKGFWKPGTAAIYNGYLGTTALLQYGQGTCNVGMSPDSPFAYTGAPGNINLHQTSLTTYIGDHRVIGRSSVSGVQFRSAVVSNELFGGTNIIAGKSVDIVGKSTAIAGANVTIGAPNLTINGLSWNGYVVPKLAVAGKGFDIPHPTKSNTHRLRYICLEGPEVGTYLRGKLKNSNVIELPEYWTEKFIDTESITVNLTSIGSFQELYVKEIVGTKIIIGNNSGNAINCNYTVFAERILDDKLQVEYEGQSPADYPGDNSQYSLAGWNYDRR